MEDAFFANVQNINYSDKMGDWLQEREWKRFITLTTGWELTLPSARRMNERLHERLTTEVFNGVKPVLFWVAEKFEAKDGYHTHGLLDYDLEQIPEGVNIVPLLDMSYQIVSGARKQGRRFHCAFSKYDGARAAGKYCSKYLLKRYADWDLLC